MPSALFPTSTGSGPTASPVRPDRIYPVLFSGAVEPAAAFYQAVFGFEVTFSSDWYVSLRHRDNPAYELAILANDHATIPEAYRGAITRCLINIEVPDATAESERLMAAGVEIVQPLRDEPFGQRHLIVAAPDGVLIDVIEEIPPSPEFAAQFTT